MFAALRILGFRLSGLQHLHGLRYFVVNMFEPTALWNGLLGICWSICLGTAYFIPSCAVDERIMARFDLLSACHTKQSWRKAFAFLRAFCSTGTLRAKADTGAS